MEIKRLKLVYFSPTGTTRRILRSIARGIGVEAVESIDLTSPQAAQRSIPACTNELAIIGAPGFLKKAAVGLLGRPAASTQRDV